MDLIEAALAKKRAAVESASGGAKKKYIRKGDLEKQREQEYLAEQERERKAKEEKERQQELEREAKRKEKAAAAAAANGSPASSAAGTPTTDSSSANTPTIPSSDNPDDVNAAAAASAATFNIAPEEVVRRLRARGHPIRLFAETDQARKIRLRALELVEDRSEGQRNDFMRAMENAETGLHMEALGQQGGSSTKEKKSKSEPAKDVDTNEISVDLIQKDMDKLYVLIYTYFKRLLREWERDLDQRPDELKRSTPGKLATATQAQSAEYLRPFFKSLRQKSLEPDVLMRITEIAELMIKREHMAANDAYLKLSIGNAPWPIGVTMVGIHERSGREKIFSAQVAHVLNDETSRKWIQSIKRIMTFAEKKYPRL
ncbi:mRNA splicing protein prp18 [Linnemannia elongata]|uniref:Pre-mRNA-splicing factor 18 n=1 Tax=Linnemannia elongata AG-77 TaxID=1314771 RepID=A0A197JHA1_9FUNG|nr:mRNA splicing protein prp18 [Linnemannia elongata]OAQ24520.1 Prp18-domain-containing protein [Linnemannia elongata AG-77]KAF9341223.1 mRNA splicing protein prp18 [Linnemannia elongata]KAG0071423.1 mRNA splicing protein prp18 [Linnemannia elongata]KAG0080647.1 mRNA splicing protein prp18 [Linnemannia elongata]